MDINKKKMQVDIAELQEKIRDSDGLASIINKNRQLVGFQLTLAEVSLVKPAADTIREQIEEIKTTSDSRPINAGLFGTIGSKLDTVIDKAVMAVGEQVASIADANKDNSHTARLIAYPEENANIAGFNEVINSVKGIESSNITGTVIIGLDLVNSIIPDVQSKDIITYENMLKQSKKLSMGLEIAIEDVKMFIQSPTEYMIESIRSLIHNGINMIISLCRAGADACLNIRLMYTEKLDVLALNLIKLVDKNSDKEEETGYIGTSDKIALEALVLNRNNELELLKSVEQIGKKSRIRRFSKKNIMALNAKVYTIENPVIIEEDNYDRAARFIGITEDKYEGFKQTESILNSINIDDLDTDSSSELAMVFIPNDYDLSNSFKAKYI